MESVRGVRIPRSSPRACRDDYVKLLRDVDPDALCGYGFEGTILRPGATVTDAQLRPSDDYPARPLLLEAAVVPSSEPACRRRNEQLYILWLFDEDRNGWTDIGRARSRSWHWAEELRAIAVRALQEQRPKLVAVVDYGEIEKRICAVVDQELRSLEDAHRWRVLGIVHDHVARRAAQLDGRGVVAIG